MMSVPQCHAFRKRFFKPSARTLIEDGITDTEAGTYVVEMALAMPLYLMLIFGFISIALLLFVYGQVTYASRAAVRYASTYRDGNGKSCMETGTYGVQQWTIPLVLGVSGGQVAVAAPSCTGNNAVGSQISVTVSVRYPVGLPYVAASGITLSSTATGYVLH